MKREAQDCTLEEFETLTASYRSKRLKFFFLKFMSLILLITLFLLYLFTPLYNLF